MTLIQIGVVPGGREYIYSALDHRGETFFGDLGPETGLSSENPSTGNLSDGGFGSKAADELVCLYGGTRPKERIYRIARSASMEAYDRG